MGVTGEPLAARILLFKYLGMCCQGGRVSTRAQRVGPDDPGRARPGRLADIAPQT